MRGIFVLLAAAVPGAAYADGAAIGVWPESARAPARLVLTASVAVDDAIVAYDWGLLAGGPRCRSASCVLDLPVAACERVEVRATTELGDVATATITACAGDGTGAPPRAVLAVAEWAGGALIEPSWALGGAPIALTRMWIDDAEVLEPARPSGVVLGDGCHAIDLLVVDVAGRFGLDRRRACGSVDAPRAWLGAEGAPYLPLGDPLALCLEAAHPLGLAVEVAAGAVPLDACGASESVPRGLERRVSVVRDARGATSFASAFVAGFAADAPPTLFFAALPAFVSGIAGRSVDVGLVLVGGAGPYRVEAALVDTFGGGRGTVAAVVSADDAAPSFSFTSESIVSGGRLEVVVTDAYGREARAAAALDVHPGSVGPDPEARAVACSASGPAEGSSRAGLVGPALFVLGLLALRRRSR